MKGISMVQVIKDNEFWRRDRFVASNGPWSLYTNPGWTNNYRDRIIIENDIGSFRDRKLSFSWEWPETGSPSGVCGFNYIAYGRYWDFGPYMELQPVALGSLKKLDFTHDIEMFNADSANQLTEFFVRAPGKPVYAPEHEIGWFGYAPHETRNWVSSGKFIGRFASRDRKEWDIYWHPTGAANSYFLIMPADGMPYLKGVVDGLSAVRFLLTKGLINAAHKIEGVALGFEPLRGVGSAVVRNFVAAIE